MKWLGMLMVTALPTIALAGGGGQEKRPDGPKPAEKPVPVEPKLEIGKAAPAFELKDTDGKTVKLSDFKGKIVVLEWFNPECPVIVKQHSEGPLKDAAANATKEGVVWLAINSSAAGKDGHGLEKNKKAKTEWKLDHPILLDEEGTVGMAYGSKNTPTMYIIDSKGMLAYRGAIDNAQEGKPELVNYVAVALREIKAGKPVSTAETKPYGCSVKYARPKS